MLVQKARKSRLSNRCKCQLWNDYHLTQLQGHGGRLMAEVGEVVFVTSANFLDHAMHAQAFEKACDLTGGFVSEVFVAQLLIGKTADEELALQQGAKQTGILFREEIEALVAVVVLSDSFSQLVKFFNTDLRSCDG